jgi:hypothetical protein
MRASFSHSLGAWRATPITTWLPEAAAQRGKEIVHRFHVFVLNHNNLFWRYGYLRALLQEHLYLRWVLGH